MSNDLTTDAGRFDSAASLPDGSTLVLRVIPLPADVNSNGDVFGGWIMAQADVAGFYARVERVGRTSITVHVQVHAERNPADPQVVKVTEANLTYVAIDGDGKPRPLAAQ